MSSIYDRSFEDILRTSVEGPAFNSSTQRSFENERHYYDQLFSLDSDDTAYIKQMEACQNLFTQESLEEMDCNMMEDDHSNTTLSTESWVNKF